MKQFCVYIMASRSRRLYVGVTSNLEERVARHKLKYYPDSFSARYNIDRLIYYELLPDALTAIAREKQIKGWRRSKKIALIESVNPTWRDL
ncbi:MAG: GIY-YIG nuclease family protein, partial [Anaerolineales bacterium]|nr:GIY-YIG nuclease family protein [Anaerolineales bacterium]